MKLLLPEVGRGMEEITIVKWHKSEGQFVAEGEDLLDIKLALKTIIKPPSGVREVIEMLTDPEYPSKAVADRNRAVGHAVAASPFYTQIRPGDKRVAGRVGILRSLDRGVLRKILVPEGQSCSVKAVLAVLTTENDEPLNDGDPGRTTAVFRLARAGVREARWE
jgi:hypothetical protein